MSGRVQGVFFRSEIKRLARVYGVVGWIRNLFDGRVEALFEGEEANVKRLVEFAHKGPRSASVTSTKVHMESFSGEFKDFRILW